MLVSFREGKLAYAQVGQEDNSLVTILYRAHKLSAAQHRALKERTSNMSDKELGLLLVNANYINQQDILSSLQSSLRQYRQPPVHLGGGPLPLRERPAAAG